ncbi:uncharacterized protein AB9W97_014136 [Spinachia spinachia]
MTKKRKRHSLFVTQRDPQAAEMLLPLVLVLTGGFCSSGGGAPPWTVLQGTEATLPCPDGAGDVTWSRFINGRKVVLVTVANGVEKTEDKRYGSRAKTSLVITNVTPFDTAMHFCNDKKVYLRVTEDPDEVGPEGGTPTSAGPGLKATAGDAENRPPPRRWRGPVGMVAAAALVMLGVLTVNFCIQNRTARTTELHKTEVIYEEIHVGAESYFDSPHHVAKEPPSRGHGWQEAVYSLAQRPLNAGSGRAEDDGPVGGLSH